MIIKKHKWLMFIFGLFIISIIGLIIFDWADIDSLFGKEMSTITFLPQYVGIFAFIVAFYQFFNQRDYEKRLDEFQDLRSQLRKIQRQLTNLNFYINALEKKNPSNLKQPPSIEELYEKIRECQANFVIEIGTYISTILTDENEFKELDDRIRESLDLSSECLKMAEAKFNNEENNLNDSLESYRKSNKLISMEIHKILKKLKASL